MREPGRAESRLDRRKSGTGIWNFPNRVSPPPPARGVPLEPGLSRPGLFLPGPAPEAVGKSGQPGAEAASSRPWADNGAGPIAVDDCIQSAIVPCFHVLVPMPRQDRDRDFHQIPAVRFFRLAEGGDDPNNAPQCASDAFPVRCMLRVDLLFTSEHNLGRWWAFGVCLSVFGKEVAGWVIVITRVFVVF